MTNEDRQFIKDLVRYVGSLILVLVGSAQYVGVI